MLLACRSGAQSWQHEIFHAFRESRRPLPARASKLPAPVKTGVVRRFLLAACLLAPPITAATSVAVTAGSIQSSPSGRPWNNFGSYSFRIEERVHGWATGDIQAVCVGGLCIRSINTDASPNVSSTVAFTGDSVNGILAASGCCKPNSDVLIRIQRDITAVNCPQYGKGCYTIEFWDMKSNAYSSGVYSIVSTNSNWSNNAGTQIQPGVNVAWIEWYTGVIPIGQGSSFCGPSPSGPCMPDVTDSQIGDLASYKFEGNLNDSSPHHANLQGGSVAFSATPVYPPRCSAGAQQVFVAGSTGTLNGFGLPLDGVSSTIASLTWQQLAGPPVTWTGQSLATAKVSGLAPTNQPNGPASYIFQLTAADQSGNLTSCTVKDGAVATDNNDIIVTNNPLVDQLVHRQLRWSSPNQPWPWFDDRAMAAANVELDNVYGLRGCSSLDFNACYFQIWWKKFGPGTVSLTDQSTTLTGTGTHFLTTFQCSPGGTPAAFSVVAIEYSAATKHYRMYNVTSCADDTHVTLDRAWYSILGTPTGNYAPESAGAAYQWSLNSNAQFPANFYDNVAAYYVMYLRTGIDDFLVAFRKFADEWWEQPTMDQGYCFGIANGGPGSIPSTSWCQGFAWRAHSMLGVILRALDKGDSPPNGMWSGMRYLWDISAYAIYINHNWNQKVGDREAGVMLAELAWCAQFDPTFVSPSTNQTCRQILDSALIHDSPFWSDPTYGGVYDGGPGGPFSGATYQVSGAAFGTTVNVANGSQTVTCVDNNGMCDWRFEGTCNTAGAAVTGLSYDGFTKLSTGSTITIGGANYTIQSVADDTHLTLTTSAGTQTGVAWYQPRFTLNGGDHDQLWILNPNYSPQTPYGEPEFNSAGDPISYEISAIIDAHHLTLATPYQGPTAGGKWWSMYFSGGGQNDVGFYVMPYMEGIAGDGLDRVARALTLLGDPNASTARSFATAASTWDRLYGLQPSTKGVWYTRGGPNCPISNTPTNSSCDEGGQDAASARILNAETAEAMQDEYMALGTPEVKVALDSMLNAMWAKPGTCAGDPACSSDGTYVNCMEPGQYCITFGGGAAPWKWFGQFFGSSFAPGWAAARLSTPTPPGPGPAILATSPSAAYAGGAGFSLTVTGLNFASDAVVQWNGTALPTTFVSSGRLMASVAASLIGSAGTASVTISTSGKLSPAASLSINPATGVSFANQRVSSQAPTAAGCSPPPAASSFLTPGGAVYLYFEAIVPPGATLSADWISADGTVVSPNQWNTASACFSSFLTIAGLPPAMLGSWQARVFANGALLFSVPFTVSATAPVPRPQLAAVKNAASYAAGTICPGEILVLQGSAMGPDKLAQVDLSASNTVGPQLAGTSVQIGGLPAPILYTSATQVSVIVPYALTGTSADVTVTYQELTSDPLGVSVQPAVPGLFTADRSGAGQVAALNQDGSVNTAASPAAEGSAVVLFATGDGPTSPPGEDGKLATAPLPQPVLPVQAAFNNVPGTIAYAGAAPNEVNGIMQINVQLPAGVNGPAVPVVLTLGGTYSSPTGPTIAITPASGAKPAATVR